VSGWCKLLKNFLLERGAQIGNGVFFGTDIYVDTGFERFLEIEDHVIIAHGVTIILHDSSLNNILGMPIKIGKTKICSNAYIGANTTILCGVEIGENSLIGAGSLVTNDIPPNTVAYGVPAKKICSLSEFKDIYSRKMKIDSSKFFYWDVMPWRNRQEKLTLTEEQNLFYDFVYKIRNHLFKGAPHSLDFGNKITARYLLFGWYDVENWPPSIRWSSKKASAYLRVNEISNKLFIKTITSYPKISANISINKQFIKRFYINTTEWNILAIDLPKLDASVIEVVIEVDETWVPDRVLKNGDTRELGIAVQNIWIE
jgi:serine acetyltransferase